MNLTHAHKARSSNTEEIFLFSWGDGATVARFCFNLRMVAYFRTSTKEHEVNRRHLVPSSPEVQNVRGCCQKYGARRALRFRCLG